MAFSSDEQAIEVLDDANQGYREREGAARFLREHPSQTGIEHLVWALQDDNFGVRWEAAVALNQLGAAILPELLKALADPHRVGDPRLREGAYHVLHYSQNADFPVPVGELMEALKGPAADISALEEAGRLLQLLEHQAQSQ